MLTPSTVWMRCVYVCVCVCVCVWGGGGGGGRGRDRPWRILLKLLPIFLFFFSPVINLFFFLIHLFFSIMLALILKFYTSSITARL